MVVDKVKSHTKAKHILLVDDVNLMCQFLNETLRVIPNVECHTASRVTTAGTILQRYAIDLAIIDLNLPDGSGLDIVKKIRKGECKGEHDIPILIFSGNTYKQAVKECLLFQVSDIVAKPIIAIELRKRVENHLNSQKKINAPEYYCEIDKKLLADAPPKVHKPSPSIVNATQTYSAVNRLKTETKLDDSVNQFIKWPSDATTGFHQIDRRLKDLCFQLNHFHFYRTEKDVYPTAKEDIKKISMCLDDLNFAIRPIKAAQPTLPIWKPFYERIKMIEELPFQKYSTPKISSENKTFFSKSLRTAWMGILTKPIIQKKK